MNIKIQVHAKQSHDKAENGDGVIFFGLFIYFFHIVLHCIIFEGLKNILFSSSPFY